MRKIRTSLRAIRSGTRTVLCGSAIATCLLAAVSAWGQSAANDPIGAEELFRQGLSALKLEDWTTACEKFRKSMVLEPAVSTQFKLAKCSEHRGKVATAWYELETALKLNRDARVSDRRRAELEAAIRAALSELNPRVSKMSITVQPMPAGLEVFRDGVPIAGPVLGEMLPVDPGDHEVVVRAPGFEEARRTVTLEQARSLEVEFRLVASKVATTSSSNQTVEAGARPSRVPTLSQPPLEAAQVPLSRVESRPPDAVPSSRWGQREASIAMIGTGARRAKVHLAAVARHLAAAVPASASEAAPQSCRRQVGLRLLAMLRRAERQQLAVAQSSAQAARQVAKRQVGAFPPRAAPRPVAASSPPDRVEHPVLLEVWVHA